MVRYEDLEDLEDLDDLAINTFFCKRYSNSASYVKLNRFGLEKTRDIIEYLKLYKPSLKLTTTSIKLYKPSLKLTTTSIAVLKKTYKN